MGRNVRPPQKLRLANMAIPPAPEPVYELPPLDECETPEWPLALPEPGHRLVVRQVLWRDDRIVDFAIIHIIRDNNEWKHVAKIDCDLGRIHRHLYNREGRDLLDHELIKLIPAVGGIVVVEEGYSDALDEMENRWQDNYRRWRGDY